MNSDIRISTTIFTNKKIRKLIIRKGHTGFYNLVSLWMDAALHRPEGAFTGYDSLDMMMAASTEDNNFIDLLVELNLLDFEHGIYSIHNWKENNLWVTGAEKRSESARKAAEMRWGKNQKTKVTKEANK